MSPCEILQLAIATKCSWHPGQCPGLLPKMECPGTFEIDEYTECLFRMLRYTNAKTRLFPIYFYRNTIVRVVIRGLVKRSSELSNTAIYV
jgi:hypothetical protein